jgi:hypothetical protein
MWRYATPGGATLIEFGLSRDHGDEVNREKFGVDPAQQFSLGWGRKHLYSS